jgi:multidrug efflux pump subunit AcrB
MSNSTGLLKEKGALAWLAGYPVAANLLMLTLIIGGLIWARNIKQEVFPEFELDSVRVSVSYPGSSPAEVERGLLLSIEDAVSGLDGVDEIRSVAREGSGTVTIDALADADIQKLAQDIKTEVDRISTFPGDAEEPRVSIASHKRDVLYIAIYGEAKGTVLHEIAEQARDELLQDPGVTQVEVTGMPPLEIGIEISQENLRRYNITLDEVAKRIRNASVELPGGGIKTPGGEILVRIKERRDYGRQFARLPIISTPAGGEVLLGQIATIRDEFEDTDQYARLNDKPAVMLRVYRVGDQTPIQVSDTVRKNLEKIEANLPEGIAFYILDDDSIVYKQRIELLLRNGAIGLVLVLILLSVFLEVRLAFWVMMGIPISFIGSFLILPTLDLSINMISLFAYIIALGIVVDDAIVVGESIYHYRQRGMAFMESAIQGVKDMAMPVTFSILTNVAAFVPLGLVPGRMGKIFKVIPAVVITVFLISLGECLFILPAHLGHQKRRKPKGLRGWIHQRQQSFSHAFSDWVKNTYGPFLDFTLKNRYLTITVFIAALIVVLAYGASGRMGFGMFPKIESDFSLATLTLPYGSAVEKTESIVERLVESAKKVAAESGHSEELVKGILARVGDGGSHSGRVTVYLAPSEVRAKIMSTDEFTKRWRKAIGDIAGTESLSFESDAHGPGSGHALTIELSHRDMAVLEKASTKLAETLGMYPRVKDVDDGFRPGKEQLDFKILPEGKSLGLTAREVAKQIRNAFYGAEVLRQQRGRNKIKVMVRLPESERTSGYSIDELMVRTPQGTEVPLREIASIKYGRSYTTIDRRHGRRVVQVGADVSPRSKANEILNDIKETAMPELLSKYPGLSYSFEGRSAAMAESMSSLQTTFLMAMIVIYAMLAIPFQSYSQPLIVMASIPYGIIGAFLGHLLMGYDLSIISMFGIVALAGVVVNDSLIMVVAANQMKKTNDMSSHDVILAAGIKRFRPILLTTLTTFGGLAPMIFETSRQARFLIPMAISLGFGILFATFITLILVPSLYMVVEDMGAIRKRFSVSE